MNISLVAVGREREVVEGEFIKLELIRYEMSWRRL